MSDGKLRLSNRKGSYSDAVTLDLGKSYAYEQGR